MDDTDNFLLDLFNADPALFPYVEEPVEAPVETSAPAYPEPRITMSYDYEIPYKVRRRRRYG